MNYKKICIAIVFLLSVYQAFSQYNKTANDEVPPNNGTFAFGTNPGWPTNAKWSSEQLADLYAGNADLGIVGIGANSVRATLPDHFLEKWGYDIRLDAYAYYKSKGMDDLTCFIGFPSDEHTDTAFYGTKQSMLFKNMYEDIWDGGANGTPVNDNNYYALYVYKTALKYGDIIKYWEIWNEPDFTSSSAASKAEGSEDSWWTRPPDADELSNLSAPVFHYIRLLRISYEVLKYVDKDDYVCLGGVGYESFLDACFRYSDNPADGSITSSHPYAGGAYFDCISFHSYPMYFLRKWSNDIGGFNYSRHSDKAVEALVNKKNDFDIIMEKYKYDGTVYPKKNYIITETNVPSAEFGWYFGSDEMQCNYLMKAIIASQMNGIQSLHTYGLYETKERSSATNAYHAMGMYRCLSVVEPYSQVANPSAYACHTTMQMLGGCTFDASKTLAMQLPETIGGGAFKNADGEFVYALWAKTATDKSETASGNYTFPLAFNFAGMECYTWDYSEDPKVNFIAGSEIALNGTPVFVKQKSAVGLKAVNESQLVLSPNPVIDILKIQTPQNTIASQVVISNVHSQMVYSAKPEAKEYTIDMSGLKTGMYYITVYDETGMSQSVPVVHIQAR